MCLRQYGERRRQVCGFANVPIGDKCELAVMVACSVSKTKSCHDWIYAVAGVFSVMACSPSAFSLSHTWLKCCVSCASLVALALMIGRALSVGRTSLGISYTNIHPILSSRHSSSCPPNMHRKSCSDVAAENTFQSRHNGYLQMQYLQSFGRMHLQTQPDASLRTHASAEYQWLPTSASKVGRLKEDCLHCPFFLV